MRRAFYHFNRLNRTLGFGGTRPKVRILMSDFEFFMEGKEYYYSGEKEEKRIIQFALIRIKTEQFESFKFLIEVINFGFLI